MKAVIVVPARYGSTRLPGKPLAEIGGTPMVIRVWRRCLEVGGVDRVIVATDDERIRNVLEDAGAEVVMTAPHHESGTDRIAEAVEDVPCDLVVNVQGDEPFIDPRSLEKLIDAFGSEGDCRIATLAAPIVDAGELYDTSVVKVVIGLGGEAIYFSRMPIPYSPGLWEEGEGGWTRRLTGSLSKGAGTYLKHIGTYAFRPDVLSRFCRWPSGEAEKSERLEQLRLLEHGEKIRVVVVERAHGGIDTPEDLVRARHAFGVET